MMAFLTELDPTSWMNHVLLFGTTRSVWGCGRVQDYLLRLGRLLLSAIFHNVDGFHGIERSDTASSAFDGFGELNELVGCRMKGATKARAAHSLKLLGVQLDASTDVAVIAPTSKRKTKLANFTSTLANFLPRTHSLLQGRRAFSTQQVLDTLDVP